MKKEKALSQMTQGLQNEDKVFWKTNSLMRLVHFLRLPY